MARRLAPSLVVRPVGVDARGHARRARLARAAESRVDEAGRHAQPIVSPIVLGVMFFGVFTPIGIVMRLAGRDAMRRRLDPPARTYWQDRDPPGPDPSGLPNQF